MRHCAACTQTLMQVRTLAHTHEHTHMSAHLHEGAHTCTPTSHTSTNQCPHACRPYPPCRARPWRWILVCSSSSSSIWGVYTSTWMVHMRDMWPPSMARIRLGHQSCRTPWRPLRLRHALSSSQPVSRNRPSDAMSPSEGI